MVASRSPPLLEKASLISYLAQVQPLSSTLGASSSPQNHSGIIPSSAGAESPAALDLAGLCDFV